MAFKPTSMLQKATLSPWFVARIDYSSGSSFHLCGFASGHPQFENGDQVTTSPLVELSANDDWGRTLNTLYWLHDRLETAEYDGDFKNWLIIMAATNLPPGSIVRGIALHVDWPHPRSPAEKFERPPVN
jgi:hypothetical protein